MVKLSQAADGLAMFAEKEILPALEGVRLWAASAALVQMYQSGAIVTKLAALLDSKAFSMLGLADATGMIDIDAAVEAAKATVRKRGKLEIDLPLLGEFKFGESDFEKLSEYIKKSEA